MREWLSGTPWLSGCHSNNCSTGRLCGYQVGHRELPDITPLLPHAINACYKNPHLLSIICSRPALTTSQAPAYQYFATPSGARTGSIPILHLWKLRARAVTYMTCSCVQHCRGRVWAGRFPAPLVIHHPLLLHGQQVSQAMAAFHGLGRPQLRPWFLCGEPGQKSSQGPDGVL